jgi:UbiD family decarboxylase
MARKPNPPVLLFDKIKDYKPGYRVLIPLGGSPKRSNMMSGLPMELSGAQQLKAMKEKLDRPFIPIPPVEVKDGPVLQNVFLGDDVDIFKFPAPKWLANDGGRYIGLGDCVIQRDPEEGWVNLGTHRVQIHDKNTATIYYAPGKHGDFIRKKYWAKGQSCPVAVTMGGDPSYIGIAGQQSVWGVSEYDYIGWSQGEPVKVIKGPVTGLPIPADAEIVFEGEMVPPEVETRIEGPFSEWTGHYSDAKPEAAFRVKAVLHRDDPIILGMLPFLGIGNVRPRPELRLWNHLEKIVPGVKGVYMWPVMGNPHCVVISLKQMYGGHAKQTALAALAHWNYCRKFVIIVDDDIDPSNYNEVLWALGMRSDPEKWDVIREGWDDWLDPMLSPQKRAMGDITQSSVIILACKPYHWINEFPMRVQSDPELEKKVQEKYSL